MGDDLGVCPSRPFDWVRASCRPITAIQSRQLRREDCSRRSNASGNAASVQPVQTIGLPPRLLDHGTSNISSRQDQMETVLGQSPGILVAAHSNRRRFVPEYWGPATAASCVGAGGSPAS